MVRVLGKNFEALLLLSMLLGVHCSFAKLPILRVSFMMLLAYLLVKLKEGRLPLSHNILLLLMCLTFLGYIPYFYFDDFSVLFAAKYSLYLFQGLIIINVIRKNNDIIWVKDIVSWFWFINILIGIYEICTGSHLQHSNIHNYTQTISRVPLGLFFNQNDYGVFMSLIAPYTVIKAVSSQYRIKYILASFVTIILLVATGSLGAYMTLAANVVLLLGFIRREKRISLIGCCFFILVLLIIISQPLLAHLEFEYIFRKVNRIHSRTIGLDRLKLLASFFAVIWKYPLGVGSGQSVVVGTSMGLTNPHSLFMEICVNYGLLGLLSALLLYSYSVLRVIPGMFVSKSLKSRDNAIVLTIGVDLLTLPLWSHVPSRMLSGFDIFWVFIGTVALTLRRQKFITSFMEA